MNRKHSVDLSFNLPRCRIQNSTAYGLEASKLVYISKITALEKN